MTHLRVGAFIPAREGSKGIPGKNLALVGGVTLVERTVRFALDHPAIDSVVVSTDGAEIAAVARSAGSSIHERPGKHAADESLVVDAIRHFLGEGPTKMDVLVLLQPTSPFRETSDVTDCLKQLHAGADSAATFTRASLHPHRAFRVTTEGRPVPFIDGAVPWLPRQKLQPDALELTGSVYAFWVDRLPKKGDSVLFGTVGAVEVPPERSLDIDNPLDLRIANALLM